MYIARFYMDKEQSIRDHLRNVSQYAEKNSINLGLSNCLILCGYLHDIGKYSSEFQDYIRKEQEKAKQGIKDKEKRVDHGVYGAKLIYNIKVKNLPQLLVRSIMAEVICYHHGGLPDNLTDDGTVPLIERIKSTDEDKYNEVLKRFFEDNPEFTMDKIYERFLKVVSEVGAVISKFPKDKFGKYLSLLIENIYSILVDADRWDSYLFTIDYKKSKEFDKAMLWKEYSFLLENRLLDFKEKVPETELERKVKKSREKVSDVCKSFAEKETGIYNLTVPTGGGKTFASLNFALNHAKIYNKDRIIYVIPYTSIIEQNAEEIRSVLNAQDTILEYHSNILEKNQNDDYEIFSERWNSPIIFTTMVQFLNSVFANGNSNIRRMHSLENSVIIFDEIQTLPIKCINLFYTLIAYLKDVCNTTSILCTATQPNIPQVNQKLGIEIDGEIISDAEKAEVFKDLKRMEIIDKTKQSMDYDEAGDFIVGVKEKCKSVLCVANTVASAENLFEIVKEKSKENVYLLTSRMCPNHRKDRLNTIKSKLKNGEDIICISTQLIEAGVDISFESVIRSLSGLDSIAQATGRGNRHGENPLGYSYIINLKEENTRNLREINIGKGYTQNLLYEYSKNKEEFDCDLLSEKSLKHYYETYFNDEEIEKNMSYPLKDNISIYAMLRNGMEICGGKHQLGFWSQFKTARENFKVIEENTETVIVPYNEEAEKLIGDLLSDSVRDKTAIFRKLQGYSVNLYSNVMNKLMEKDALNMQKDYGLYILNDNFYSEKYGVNVESRIKAEKNMFF